MTVSNLISQAIGLLEEAQEEAGMGTSMMLRPIISELRDIHDRLDNINNATGNTDEQE